MSIEHSLSGRALHTGVPSTVRVVRREDDHYGLRFVFPGFNAPLAARDLATLTRRAHRATVLTHPRSGAVIRTPEHLLAAALFFADHPLDIICDAEEIPGGDGSAKPWFDVLQSAAAAETFTPSPRGHGRASERGEGSPPKNPFCREYDSSLSWAYAGREGTLQAEPAPRFSVRYTLERGTFQDACELIDIADAPAEILPARTFIFWGDWQALRLTQDAALLDGVDENSGLLLAESAEEFTQTLRGFPGNAGNTFPLLHPRGFRMKGEAARHKVLDLLGDLALGGLALPRLRLTIRNGGHALNHLLMDALHAHSTRRADTIHEDEGAAS